MTYKLDLTKFESGLVAEQKYLVRKYNEFYAGRTCVGKDLTKGLILAESIDTYTKIIEILQESMVNENNL
jgi:hypothetical protein